MQIPASFRSFILSKFGVSANCVSISRVILCILILPLFLFSNKSILLGLLVFYFALISDCIDGQLSRYYGSGSLEGTFVDGITSSILVPCMYIALGLVAYSWSGEIWGLLIVAFILGFSGLFEKTRNTLIIKLLFKQSSAASINREKESCEYININSVPVKKVNKKNSLIEAVILLLNNAFFLILRFVLVVIAVANLGIEAYPSPSASP